MGGTTPPYVPLQFSVFIGTPPRSLVIPKPLPEFMLHYLRETLSNLK